MEIARKFYRRAGWLALLAWCAACGCQTVRTPEEKIANGNIPREFQKVSMPDYILEPPDLVIVEVLEALPGRPISGERLVRPDADDAELATLTRRLTPGLAGYVVLLVLGLFFPGPVIFGYLLLELYFIFPSVRHMRSRTAPTPPNRARTSD